MSNSCQRRLEELTSLIDRLAEESSKGVPIIVEGKKDALTLQKLGITGRVICVKASCKPLYDFLAEECQGIEIIILTDFDHRGAQLSRTITQYLQGLNAEPNLHFWKEIGSLIKRDVKDVEGLASYIEKLKLMARDRKI
ncbi:toprim domain-containing protein [Candidatus Bathyarchaeota archaeon]|nr:toprim domain-containing protein [Candidatus Bathyarchaeota archaeon]